MGGIAVRCMGIYVLLSSLRVWKNNDRDNYQLISILVCNYYMVQVNYYRLFAVCVIIYIKKQEKNI